ncbi:MAG: DUF4975 domain-containing protein [Lachnospiraceae bacterium]|nr:DUF4975 domain-containing protein [Lachnospiraceae bacterium]
MYFRPKDSVAGDIIPFYRDGSFRLFYLRDYRNAEKYGEGTPWHLLETKDFVRFTEKGEVISRGDKEEQDLYVYTGSVFEKENISYIFYTGYNPYFMKQGKRREAVMLSTSTDFQKWEKQEGFCLCAPDCFEPHDFRDPFVFFNEETGEYNMLLAARLNYGPSRRRGCTALAVSDDLLHWEVREKPFYSPRLYFTHECPDLFRIGDWWYLVFSEFTQKCETHYRMSRSLDGPWLTPEYDTFDNRNFYAAKTVSDGKDRYLIGWNPTHVGEEDFADTQWGGSVIVHRLVQRADGQLYVALPQTIKEAYGAPVCWQEGAVIGSVSKLGEGWRIGCPEGFSSLDLGKLEENCRISFRVSFEGDCKIFYLYLNSDEDNEAAYYVGIDLVMGRLTFDRWPRKRSDYPFMLETERKIPVEPGRSYCVDVIKEGSVLEVYFDEKAAMSARMYELAQGTFGFATQVGTAQVTGLAYLTADE